MVVPVGTVFVPMPGGSTPSWINFNQEDQATFASCLREELERLGILKMMPGQPTQAASPDVTLKVFFERTIRNPNNDYSLNVVLDILTPQERLSKKYSVSAFEGESGWTKFSGVSAWTGKKMAAQKLLNAMIPDIEAAVRTLGTRDEVQH